MRSLPSARELVGVVAERLDQGGALKAFEARVAANVLRIVERELELGDDADAGARTRLVALLGREGSAEELEIGLAHALAGGSLSLLTPGVRDHLWASTMAELAIDQPSYATYRRAREEGWRS